MTIAAKIMWASFVLVIGLTVGMKTYMENNGHQTLTVVLMIGWMASIVTSLVSGFVYILTM